MLAVSNSITCVFLLVLFAGHCSGGAGFVPETYIIEQAALYGGVPCPEANNTIR